MKTLQHLREAVVNEPARSAWSKGVKVYALELIDSLLDGYEYPGDHEFYGSPADEKELLNGADDWKEFSYGGCALIYDQDIAERLCSPSEYKRTSEGRRNPNARENWLDVQARALLQAANLIFRIAKR